MRAWIRVGLKLPVVLTPLVFLYAQEGRDGPQGNPHGDLPLDCGACHSAERWVPADRAAGFRHEITGFRLEGAHAGAACRACHRSLVFNEIGTACVDCHQDAHRGELGPRCEGCHAPKTWSNQTELFHAHSRTRFPLFAVHAKLDCQACHRNQRPFEYANTPAECGACHAQTFQETRNPDHARAGFSRSCEECHPLLAQSWREARFVHPASFPLIGRHASAQCADCHAATFRGTATLCLGCHLGDFNQATNPSHTAGGFSTSCQDCHTQTAWRPATIDHNQTRFPLSGAHQGVDCARCHQGNRFTGTPTDCFACHQGDYSRATNPSHAGFSTRCETCHNTAAWRPASFDHNRTRFPLTGAHQRVDCARCHPGGRYAGTPTDCFACHQPDYNRTTNPSHAAAGFPTRCQECHTTSAWRPASFDHDGRYFPIYSGQHQGEWSSCSECHINPGNYRAFECILCHSDKSEVDDDHKGVAGYVYQSAACYRCHPRGTK